MALCTTAQCDGYYKFVQKLKNILEFVIFENHLTILGRMMDEGRKVHDYFLLLPCKSSIWFTEKYIFKIIIYFFDASKFVANYLILFEVYDGFIGQKILKL